MSPHSSILIILLKFLLTEYISGSYGNLYVERLYPTPAKDSPQLPLLLQSLSIQKYSPDTASDIFKEYDYIVVGAGAAGSVVAVRLSEVPCVSVLLLEAGPSPPQLSEVPAYGSSYLLSKLDWKYETTSQKHTGKGQIKRKFPLPSAKCIGGSTIHNNGLHVRGNKKDYDDWAMMGAEGWNYENVLPFFKKLEDNKYYKNVYHGTGGPITVEKPRYLSVAKQPILDSITAMGFQFVDPNAEQQTGFYDQQVNLRQTQRCSPAKAYLVPAAERTNLDILSNAFVRKVVIENKRAVGVVFHYGFLTYNVKARREIILSAGALNTPQILMLSGIGPEKHLHEFNIPVHANLPVGMNFQDHGALTVQAALKPEIQEFAEKLSNETHITEYIINRSGPLASAEGIIYTAFLNAEDKPGMDFPDYELYLGESSSKGSQKIWNLKPEVYQQVYGPYKNGSLLRCGIQQLHPYSRGRIQLQSADPYDPPIINPNYLDDPRDVKVLVAGLKLCKRIFDRPEMKQVIAEPFQTLYPGCEKFVRNEDAYFRCVLRTVLYTASHYCCSAKMGDAKDPETVLDPQLRVKDIKGLRVADTSVMPKVTSGNTGVPAIMIGEKAADMIKKTITCGKVKCNQKNAAASNSTAESNPFGGGT